MRERVKEIGARQRDRLRDDTCHGRHGSGRATGARIDARL